MTDFSERLRALRMDKQVSQQDLADYLGVNKQTVSGYERGIRRPAGESAIDTYEKIADYFNVDISYLIGTSEVTTKISKPSFGDGTLPDKYAKQYAALNETGKRTVHFTIESEYKKEQERMTKFKNALKLDHIVNIEDAKAILGDVAAFGGYASDATLIKMADKTLQELKKNQ